MDKTLRLQVILALADKALAPLNRTGRAGRDAAKNLRSARDAVRELERAQADLSSFRQLKTDTGALAANLRAARARATELGGELARVQKLRLASAGARDDERGHAAEMKAAAARLAAAKAAVAGSKRPGRRMKADLAEAEKAVKSITARWDAAKARVKALDTQLAAVPKTTRQMNAEFARARKETLGLETALGKSQSTLNALRAKLGDAGIGARNLAESERRLRGETARANEELEKQQARLKAIEVRNAKLDAAKSRYADSQSRAGALAATGAGAATAGAAILTPMVGAWKESASFQSGMTDIGQKADLTRAQARALGDELVALGPKVGQLPENLRAGVDVLSGFGLDPRAAVRMIGPIGKVATAYKAEMADVSAASFAAQDNLKVPIEQTGRVLDIMAYAGKRGAFELRDMAQYFPQLTAAAQGLGQKGAPAVADLAAALQITRKGAGDSASAATNLDNLLQKIASPATSRAFAKMGVDLEASMKKAAKAGKTPIEAITELTNAALKGDLSKLGYLFEDAQVQKALRPLIQNFDEYKAIRADAMKATGVVDSDFANRMQDDADKARMAAIEIDGLKLSLGAKLGPAIVGVIGKAGALAGRLTKWANAHPALTAALGKTAGALGVALVLFGGLALACAAVLSPFALLRLAFANALPVFAPLARGVMFLSTALWGMVAPLLANPITWIVLAIVAAIGLLVGAAYLIVKHWGPISRWFGRLWDTLKATVGPALAAIGGFIMRFTPLGFFIRAFAPLWRWMGGMIGKVAGLLGPVLSWLGGMLGRLGGVLAGAFAYLGGLFMRFTPLGFIIRNWAPIGGFLANLWNGAKALVGQAMTALIGFIAHGDPVGALIAAFAKVWPWLTGLAGRFQTIGGQLMAGMVAGITNGLAGLKKAITGMAGQAVGWIKQKLGIHSPSRVFAGLGRYTMAGLEQGIRKGQDGPLNAIRQTAAALAAGMAATAAVAAPASPTAGGVGPRLTSPPAASAAPQRGGDHIEIHIHSLPSQSPADIAREVRKALADVERERAGRARASFSDEE